MSSYYNEHDTFAAAWLRELIKDGQITDGTVDERDIQDVQPADLRGFDRCHFFAGIGGWDHALKLAGWPNDRPIWTGSCPCQPFSTAGKGKGGADDRHLWPHWFRLLRECRPTTVFGEQVAAAIGHGWLDLVSTDLEGEGYAVGAVVLGAHSVGAPHIRPRLWFVADSEGVRRPGLYISGSHMGGVESIGGPSARFTLGGEGAGGVADSYDGARRADSAGRDDSDRAQAGRHEGAGHDGDGRAVGELGDTDDQRSQGRGRDERAARPDQQSPWAADSLEWLPCRDGKARPTQPGLQPLAHGVSARVGQLRGYGNAIVPQVAAEVIRAYMDVATWGLVERSAP